MQIAQISKDELAPVFGAALIGMNMGALISGIFADKFSQRKNYDYQHANLIYIYNNLCLLDQYSRTRYL
ncbi:hypothetical protein [Acinetobacter baumannii]|uniref:hypothetical protein n=1 Tax=Acinetobacter baumannii TaxID=470 RepID=UPI001D17D466|nr:hypothetical protein [Acinetobacter baumannii]